MTFFIVVVTLPKKDEYESPQDFHVGVQINQTPDFTCRNCFAVSCIFQQTLIEKW